MQDGEDKREHRQTHVRADSHGRAGTAPRCPRRVREEQAHDHEGHHEQVGRDSRCATEDPGRHAIAGDGLDGHADEIAGHDSADRHEYDETDAGAGGAGGARQVTRHVTPAR